MRKQDFGLAALVVTLSVALAPMASGHPSGTSTWTGTIRTASLVCGLQSITANPLLCPFDAASPHNHVASSAVTIPAHYRDGKHVVRLTGSIPRDAQGQPGRLSIAFGNPGDTVDGQWTPWPAGTSTVDAVIPAGSSAMRVQPFVYRGAAANVTWTLRIIA